MPSVNFDPIARPYRWLEYLSFGRELERRRFRYLPEVKSARRALVLGDGDGRFLAALVRQGGEVSVDYVDLSARMLEDPPFLEEMRKKMFTVDYVGLGLLATGIGYESLPFRSDIADVADAVAYLLSHESRFVTGQELHVNGGWYMG